MRGLHTITHTANATVIQMQAIPADCWVCGADATGLDFGIPVYEGNVLPNDWKGEWGGVPVCKRCFDAQQTITRPIAAAEFLRELPK